MKFIPAGEMGRKIFLGRILKILMMRRGISLFSVFLGCVVFGYILYQFTHLVSMPSLVLGTPSEQYVVVKDPFIDIGGTLKEEARLLINRRPISVIRGAFSERMYLALGVNKIDVEAINLRGKQVDREIFVVYNP